MKSPQLAVVPPPADQLMLFEEFISKTPEGYSNTIELFDSLLRFTAKRVRSDPEPDIRTIIFRGKEIRVTISPAVIKRRGSPASIMMPGQREDLVEKALRKLAAERVERWSVDKDMSGTTAFSVRFSLYQLRKLLIETGHDFKIVEIDEALRVLQGANIEFDGASGNFITGSVSGIIASYSYHKARNDQSGKSSLGEVRFHPLVAASIIQKTFRRIDFGQLMRLKVDLARWLYQRMSHFYTQACADDWWRQGNGYHLSLGTILRESGIEKRSRIRDNIKTVRSALNELVESGVLHSFEENLKTVKGEGKPGRNPVYDAVWMMKPSEKLVNDVVAANVAQKDMLRATPPKVLPGN